jgi:protein-tyrosine phosphatase
MFNFRDIGGCETPEGTVKRGMLLRSNALVDLGESDRAEIRRLRIRTAVDMREEGERAAEPSDLEGVVGKLYEVALIAGAGSTMTIDLLEFNQWLLAERGDKLAEVIRIFSAEDALPAIFFCSTGKDRTGLIAALILSAIGVDDDAVAGDYAVSETLLPESYLEQALARARAGGLKEDKVDVYRKTGLSSPASVMHGTLDTLRGRYGGAYEYLQAHGMKPGELAALKAALLATA